jgi:murein L,D-transpeptidase YafK
MDTEIVPGRIKINHMSRIGLVIGASLLIGVAAVMVALQRRSAATVPAPLALPLVNPQIVVIKSRRQLMLYAGDQLLRTYPIGLGFNPVGDKIKEGDGATPEGRFYVFTKNVESKFYLSLGVSYPNLEDAERGLRDGLINGEQYERIVEASRQMKAPPQDTPLGGQIYIHGHGARTDWTRGCVALDDRDVKELFDAVPVGTTVIIKP